MKGLLVFIVVLLSRAELVPGRNDCEFSCYDGHCLLRTQRCDHIRHCKNGEDEDKCGRLCRGKIPKIKHAQYTGILPLYNTDREIGRVLEYRCGEGYIRDGGKVKCGQDLQWTTFKCVVGCFEIYNQSKALRLGLSCGKPCSTTSDCTTGEVCKCEGPCSRVCVHKTMNCSQAPVIENANVTIIDGSIARCQCHKGYYLASGKLSMRCLMSGNIWDESNKPVCEPVLCGDPSVSISETQGMMSGTMDYYYYGAVVNFFCPSNYRLFGSSIRRCMDSGQWSGDLAACDPKVLPPNTTASTSCQDTNKYCQLWKVFCRGNNYVRRACTKTCRLCWEDRNRDRCPHPGRPINGRIIGDDFSIGATVRFECDEGYILYGDEEQECLYFREWSGPRTPICADYRYPHNANEQVNNIVSTLTRSLANLPEVKTTVGRKIEKNDIEGKHEIYFVFDSSEAGWEQLGDVSKFAIRLVRRLEGFKGTVYYCIILFASDYVTLRNVSANVHHADDVVEKLKEIEVDAMRHGAKLGTGRATSIVLQQVYDQIGINNETEPDRRKHVFMFINGMHTEGTSPVDKRKEIEDSYKNTEFYSITSCHSRNDDAIKELKGLSTGEEGNNFIHFDDFYLLSQYLDRVTTVDENYSECGKIGNQESVKRLAATINYKTEKGENAEEDTWRWQVLITKRGGTIAETLSTDSNVIGGGSIINEHWILTAAHLLHDDYLEKYNDLSWMDDIALFVGIWERPESGTDAKKSVEVYEMKNYMEHTGYTPGEFDSDIALIQVGARLQDNLAEKYDGEGLTFGHYIRPVCLPCTGTCVKNEDLDGNEGWEDAITDEDVCEVEGNFLRDGYGLTVVTGFGHTKRERGNHGNIEPAKRLQKGYLKVENDEECKIGMERIKEKTGENYLYTENMICCQPANSDKRYDACKGDSGGAVVREVKHSVGKIGEKKDEYSWVAIGIVSFGLGCARGDIPGYYTQVARFVRWINETTGGMLPHRTKIEELPEPPKSCDSEPCQNGGTCNELEDGYTCQCVVSWEGTNCEQNIDECSSNPCQNGGTCQDLTNAYQCQCKGWWTGTNCEEDIDECISNPCYNGGSCENLENEYKCQCSAGWTGINCDEDIDECTSAPCKNGGRCDNLLNKYKCICVHGWTGANCEEDVDDCDPNPCKNGGECTDKFNDFKCTCIPPWTETTCERKEPERKKGAETNDTTDDMGSGTDGNFDCPEDDEDCTASSGDGSETNDNINDIVSGRDGNFECPEDDEDCVASTRQGSETNDNIKDIGSGRDGNSDCPEDDEDCAASTIG